MHIKETLQLLCGMIMPAYLDRFLVELAEALLHTFLRANLVMGGLLAFAGLEGQMPHAVFGTMLVPGLMYLCCWCSEKRSMRPEGDTKSRPY